LPPNDSLAAKTPSAQPYCEARSIARVLQDFSEIFR
jgi:hypothetical protein